MTHPKTAAEVMADAVLEAYAKGKSDAMVQQSETSGKWQPMEAAPKDGTRILAYQKGLGRIVCEYEINAWWPQPETYDTEHVEPTHWQPLAAQPTESSPCES